MRSMSLVILACVLAACGPSAEMQATLTAAAITATAAAWTDTPIPSFTPSATLTPTITPSPTIIPTVTFIRNAFCRMGPGVNYTVVNSIEQGQEATPEGRNQDASWWLVLHPDGKTRCWVSATTVEPNGDLDTLPLGEIPPLPEDVWQFVISNRICNASGYRVRLAWADVEGEAGYYLYREGRRIATLGANVTARSDTPPFGGPYAYGLEAFNENGVSARLEVGDIPCP